MTISPGKMRDGSPDRRVDRFWAIKVCQYRATSASCGRPPSASVSDARAMSQRLSPGATTTRDLGVEERGGVERCGVERGGVERGGVEGVGVAVGVGADRGIGAVSTGAGVSRAGGSGARTTGSSSRRRRRRVGDRGPVPAVPGARRTSRRSRPRPAIGSRRGAPARAVARAGAVRARARRRTFRSRRRATHLRPARRPTPPPARGRRRRTTPSPSAAGASRGVPRATRRQGIRRARAARAAVVYARSMHIKACKSVSNIVEMNRRRYRGRGGTQ